MRIGHVWVQVGSFAPNKNFFGGKLLIFFLSTHCAKFWKILTTDPELWGCAIFDPKWVYLPKRVFFFRKALFLSFMPIYIPKTKFRYQSNNEILTIREYWNLIGQESSLGITWESCFSQACSFFAEC